MDILAYLIPISLILGGTGLAAFFWAIRSHQFDDPEGDAARILCADWDKIPKAATDTPIITD
jgi:cbb3-type cytochrome oxidase maturation protein